MTPPRISSPVLSKIPLSPAPPAGPASTSGLAPAENVPPPLRAACHDVKQTRSNPLVKAKTIDPETDGKTRAAVASLRRDVATLKNPAATDAQKQAALTDLGLQLATIVNVINGPDGHLLPRALKDEIGKALREGGEAAEAEDDRTGPSVLEGLLGGGIPWIVDCVTTSEAERVAAAAKGTDFPQRQHIASTMIKLCDGATEDDAELIRRELERLPKPVLEKLHQMSVYAYVVRDSLLNARPELAESHPRGWGGAGWDRVAGLFSKSTNEALFATRDFDGARIISNWHGSAHLVMHEMMHAYDKWTGGSQDPEFLAAREADKDCLSTYELQDDEAGREESYAESAALFFAADPEFIVARPHLYAYFKKKLGAP